MKIKFQTLALQCKRSREVIEFASQVNFFHGGIGAGKSSIARLIDYCLGGELEQTQALSKEMVSAELSAEIERHLVIFERQAGGANQVQVTWKSVDREAGSVLAPIKASASPIWNDDVYNLSDLIFYLFGIKPLKVRKSKQDDESKLVRLSFRDIMWYCYLQQESLDSSFYRLKEPIIQAKSRDVMRFVVGYYTERLQDLEVALDRATSERAAKIGASQQIRSFLQELGYNKEYDVSEEIEQTANALEDARAQQSQVREGYRNETHFADQLRRQLRTLSERLGQEEQTLADLQQRLDDHQSLKAEVLTARFKLARAESASAVLSGVEFDCCPACGTKVHPPDPSDPEQCQLCHAHPQKTKADSSSQNESVKRDLESRIDELSDSIERARKSIRRQTKFIDEVKHEKNDLDRRLTQELENYDSQFVAQTRDADHRVATLEERGRSLDRLKKLPETIDRLVREADERRAEEERLRREIHEETAGLTAANEVVEELEEAYIAALNAVGVPGVHLDDRVHIDRKSWIPSILEQGQDAFAWNFYGTGSGGKKTLVNVCYAIALHQVASVRGLPLPSFLIIDTPMKNIGEDVNREVFVSFYRYLYGLANGPLQSTQLIIIDKEFIGPEDDSLDLMTRFMTPDEDENPPLISYYRGA